MESQGSWSHKDHGVTRIIESRGSWSHKATSLLFVFVSDPKFKKWWINFLCKYESNYEHISIAWSNDMGRSEVYM